MALSQDNAKHDASGPPQSLSAAPARTPQSPLAVLLPIVVATLAVAAFRPALDNDLVTWGDGYTLIQNSQHRGLDPANIAWMFTNLDAARYQPLTWLNLALDCRVWEGDRCGVASSQIDPFGYHFGSLLLHVVNAILLYLVARKLIVLTMAEAPSQGAAVALGAAAAAAVFAVHPLRVESVAWAAARSDVLSAAFYLIGILAYLQAHGERQCGGGGRRWVAISVAGMVLSFLAGNSLATSVLVVVILDVYPLRRLGGGPRRWFGPAVRHIWLEKVPFALVAIAIAVATRMAGAHVDMLQGLPQAGGGQRVSTWLLGLSLGMWKTFWPAGLSPLYSFSAKATVVAGLVLAATGLLAWALRRRWGAPLAAWLCYLAVLLPALCTFGRNGYIAADRHTYLACLGWAVVLGGTLTWCLRAASRGDSRRAVPVLASVFVIALTVLLSWRTQKQCRIWAGSCDMWEQVVSVAPDCFIARLAYGEELLDQGSNVPAADELREAVRLAPRNARACRALGVALYYRGRAAEAQAVLSRAVDLAPGDDSGHRWLARALSDQGKLDAALAELRTALKLAPDTYGVYFEIAAVQQKQGRLDDAIATYNEVIRRQPNVPDPYHLAATALMEAGRYADAKRLLQAGVNADGESTEIANTLAWLLATCPDAAHRDGAEAIKLAEFACEATRNESPAYIDTLAAAYAEAGRFDDAVRVQRLAVNLVEMAGVHEIAAEFQARLALFEKHEPYREVPRRTASSRPTTSQAASAKAATSR